MKVRHWFFSLLCAGALMAAPQAAFALDAAHEADGSPGAAHVSAPCSAEVSDAVRAACGQSAGSPAESDEGVVATEPAEGASALPASDGDAAVPVAVTSGAPTTTSGAAETTAKTPAAPAEALAVPAEALAVPAKVSEATVKAPEAIAKASAVPAKAPEATVKAADNALSAERAGSSVKAASPQGTSAAESAGGQRSASASAKTPASKAASADGKAEPKPSKQASLSSAATTASGLAKASKSKSRAKALSKSAPVATVSARINVENAGVGTWKKAASGSMTQVGKVSQENRINVFQAKVDSKYAGSIEYQGYVQGEGWTLVRRDGQLLGNARSSNWLEGVRIALTGEASRHLDLGYRIRMVNGKWGAWTPSGSFAGVTNDKSFIKAIRIRLTEKKASKAPAEGIVSVTYRAHTASAGTQARRTYGGIAGDTGRASAIDTFDLEVSTGSVAGGVVYRAFVDGREWTDWTSGGTSIGSPSERLPISALQVRLTGDAAKRFDIAYRACSDGGAWQSWVANGAVTGKGGSSAVNALQVVLKKKDTRYAVSEGVYIITRAENAGHELAASGTGLKRASFNADNAQGKFYVHVEKGGVSIQSVSTGKFITAGVAPTLKEWSGSAEQVWKTTWNGGLCLTNAATGKVLGLASKAYNDSKGSGFMIRAARLLNNGTYTFKNYERLMALDLVAGNWSSGANFQVWNPNGTGNQAFEVAHVGGGYYTIVNTMTGGAVSVNGASKASGANVLQRGANSAAKAQQWKPAMDRTGSFSFINRASGKALTARSGGKSGGNVESVTLSGSGTQLWWLEATSWRFTGDRALDRFIFETAADNDYDLRDCFNWMGTLRHVQSVDSRIHYGIMDDDVSLSYVEIARDRGVADCYTDAGMFCWLARACGYDANMRAGGCPSASGGTVPHGWTEVYVGGVTYVCDPNLRRDLPSYNWYMVTYASAPVEYSL